jgi:hypothetical protein
MTTTTTFDAFPTEEPLDYAIQRLSLPVTHEKDGRHEVLDVEGRIYPECPKGAAIVWLPGVPPPMGFEAERAIAWALVHITSGNLLSGQEPLGLPYLRRFCTGIQEIAIALSYPLDLAAASPPEAPVEFMEAITALVATLHLFQEKAMDPAKIELGFVPKGTKLETDEDLRAVVDKLAANRRRGGDA